MASLENYSIFSIWDNNCQGAITIVNKTNSVITDWSVTVIITSTQDIHAYDINIAPLGNGLFQITPKEWNSTLAPNNTVYSGFQCTFSQTPPIIYPYNPIPPPQPDNGGNNYNI